MPAKPQYVVRIDDGYYSRENAWKPVTRDLATRMGHKEAHATRGRLKRLRYSASVEPADLPDDQAEDGPNPGDGS